MCVLCEVLPARDLGARRGALEGEAGTVCPGEDDSEFWNQINSGVFLGFELPNYVTPGK